MAFALTGGDFHVRFDEGLSVSLPLLFLGWGRGGGGGGGGGGGVTTCSLLAILRLSVSLCRGCFDL